jgi:hypothetical protein
MTALGELFKQSLITAVGKSAAVFDYGATEDFQQLWGTDTGAPAVLKKVNGKQAIIIVWDGRKRANEDANANLLEPHLTPLDWALAFSIKVLGDTALESRRNFRIHVIDLTGKAHDEWAMRMRHQLLADMPWLTLHAPLIPNTAEGEQATYREGYQPILDGCGLLEQRGSAWVLRGSGKTLAKYKAYGKNLGDLAKQWVASLTQSDDHHDVNNVIGADILTKPEERRRGLFGAFLTRLAWNGQEIESLGNWVPWDVDEVRNELFGRALSVLVVDDQIEQGWDRFVCRLLGNQRYNKHRFYKPDRVTKLNVDDHPINNDRVKVNVYGCKTSEPLIRFLENDAVFDRRDYSGEIMSCVGQDPHPEIILLDLRLYQDVQVARTQAKRLLDVVQNKAQGSLAWKAIDPDEIERIKGWCNLAVQSARVADEALLLLPRLLALALPLTPIILFSSTGRSWIRERVKSYQNIFTGFEKPRVLGDVESVTASIAALREGLGKAIRMARLRLQLAHAQRAATLATMDRPVSGSRLGRNHHIEIYADETGYLESGITSGMAVCAYADDNTAMKLQHKLLSEYSAVGVVWARRHDGRKTMLSKGKDISRDGDACRQQVELLDGLLNRASIGADARTLWSVVSTRVEGKQREQKNVSLAAFPDAPLDEALRFNLEFTLYVLIPFLSDQDGFMGTIDIRLPTRLVTYAAAQNDFAKRLCDAFDLGNPFQEGGNCAVTTSRFDFKTGFGNAFPLVRGWLHEWRFASPVTASQIVRIKMTILGRGEDGIGYEEAEGRRLFHDIADWVCTASSKHWDNQLKKKVWPMRTELESHSIFLRWYISTDEDKDEYKKDYDNARLLMRAFKASFLGNDEDGSESDALRLVLQSSYVNECHIRLGNSEHCSQQRLILWKLRHELDYAQGRTLHSLLPVDATPPLRLGKLIPDLTSTATGSPNRKDPAMVESDDGTRRIEPVLLKESDSSAVVSQRAQTVVQLPEIMEEQDLRSKFQAYGAYEVVKLLKFGTVFCKLQGAVGYLGTHLVQDKSLVLQLQADGWANPVILYGIENEALLNRSEKGLRVVAAKLADGRWKIIGAN